MRTFTVMTSNGNLYFIVKYKSGKLWFISDNSYMIGYVSKSIIPSPLALTDFIVDGQIDSVRCLYYQYRYSDLSYSQIICAAIKKEKEYYFHYINLFLKQKKSLNIINYYFAKEMVHWESCVQKIIYGTGLFRKTFHIFDSSLSYSNWVKINSYVIFA